MNFDLSVLNSSEAKEEAVNASIGSGFETGLNENVTVKEVMFSENDKGTNIVSITFVNSDGKKSFSKLYTVGKNGQPIKFAIGIFTALMNNIGHPVDNQGNLVLNTTEVQLQYGAALNLTNIPVYNKVHVGLVRVDYTNIQGQDKFKYDLKGSYRVSDNKTFSEFIKNKPAKDIEMAKKLKPVDERVKETQTPVNDDVIPF